MVPLKLSLRNFMCYRALDPPLEFTGIHVACLSGPNGAGKSALLDAMTWALWGAARARSDDELVTLGQTEMEVELEFALGEERYRVLRKRIRPGPRKMGQSLLELQAADPDGFFRPITGNTLRETQRQIEELLRLDYQTFINSALLLQGRSDEFTLKAPGERKRVLGEVLGLSRYDEYEEKARAEARRLEGELAGLRGEMAQLEQEVALRGEYEAALRARQAEHGHLAELADAQERALAGLQEAQRARAEKQARLAETQQRAREAEAELKELEAREASLLLRIAEFRSILAQRQDIQRAQDEHRAMVREHERLGKAFQDLFQLREEANRLERTIDAVRARLAGEESQLRQQAERLREVAAQREPAEAALHAAGRALEALPRLGGELADQRARLEEISRRVGALQHTNQEIIRQGQELRKKVEQLSAPGATGVCPLCGSQLGPDGHRRILEEYHQELGRQRQIYRENQRELRALQEEQARRQAAAGDLEQAMTRERAAAQAESTAATRVLQEAEKAAAELTKAEGRLRGAEAALAGEQYAPEAQAALAEVRRRIGELSYDPARHQAAQARLRELEPWMAAAQRHDEAERRLPQEEVELVNVQEGVLRWRGRHAEELARAGTLREELAALPDRAVQVALAQQELAATRDKLALTNHALGRVQAQLDRCAELLGILGGRRREAVHREREKAIYDELAVAFGRRGVQALLIETALPELEEEANQLLGRMTDNRMHLALSTQRQTRSGTTIETLDINIGDELGTRGYELYSGGEAFRINFALRIAISKMLARRAGAPLPTLIIDEGFGTQDTTAREKLIEAVNAIAGDFQRVLVITHIDELKDAFPLRIEVSKTPEGSRVQIM